MKELVIFSKWNILKCFSWQNLTTVPFFSGMFMRLRNVTLASLRISKYITLTCGLQQASFFFPQKIPQRPFFCYALVPIQSARRGDKRGAKNVLTLIPNAILSCIPKRRHKTQMHAGAKYTLIQAAVFWSKNFNKKTRTSKKPGGKM